MNTPPFILSIDWDFFVGDTNLCFSCSVCRWSCHGADTYSPFRRGANQGPPVTEHYQQILLSPVLLHLDQNIWRGVPVLVADCHGTIYWSLKKHSYVYNIDYHKDYDSAEVSDSRLTCGNWGSYAAFHKGVHYEWCYRKTLPEGPSSVVRPRVLVRSDRRYEKPSFIFICLSSPYTNPKYDKWFYKAVFDVCNVTKTAPDFRGLGKRELKSNYLSWFDGKGRRNAHLLSRNKSTGF